LRQARPVIEDDKPKVPSYIVTFSDMVTLLLTFFVMLLSLAEVQDPELFNLLLGFGFELPGLLKDFINILKHICLN